MYAAIIQMMQGTMKMPVLIGALIVAAIIAFASMFFPRISPFGAPIYAAVEGVVLGSISAVYTMKFGDSIVLNAVSLTLQIELRLL
ncbi:Bax inhibitor-1/YccA family membrane protein, partial [Escherichia sp. HC-CC]